MDMENLEFFGDRIFFEEIKPERKSAGGIYLPESKFEADFKKGKCLYVGDLVTKIKPGDIFYYENYDEKDFVTSIQERTKLITVPEEYVVAKEKS
uniref:Putative chaperonin n=1 Tax=viral metagenome TaxID=1070528 RepID=A0A6M3KFS3_9ZZZZ